MRTFRGAVYASALLSSLVASAAQAQISDDVVKIGILTDMSGPFSDQTGQGSAVGARMAIEEFNGRIGNARIQLVVADHQNKPDVASNIARTWFDQDGVDLIADLGSSAAALAVQTLGKEKKRLVIVSGAGTDRLTNDSCSPFGIHWTYDTYAAGRATANALLDQGLDTWFFVSWDSAFSQSLEQIATKTILARGGKVLGSVKHPVGTNDFSSYILQAQASGAKVIAFANSGTDFIQAVKQARQFGITGDLPRLTGPAVTIKDIRTLGPQDAKGLRYVEAFFWDLDDTTRRFSDAFRKNHGAVPGQAQAGVYSAVRSYLQAVKDLGTDNAEAVVKKLRETKVHDAFTPDGIVRADGRMMHEMYLLEAKGPAEVKGDWDLVKLVARIPADQAFRPLTESECPLVK
jgi:branched-chain amino acid transport system substrate-binding protein